MNQAPVLPYANRLITVHGMMGFIQYAIGFSVPLIKRDLEISRVLASLHNIGWALAVITLSILIPRHIHKYPPHRLLRFGWILTIIGIFGFCLGRTLWITVPSFTLSAIGATIFNNTNSATLGSHSGTAVKMMLRTTGIGGLFGSISPTIIGIFTRGGVEWRYTIMISTIIFGTLALIMIPQVAMRDMTGGNRTKIRWDKSFLILAFFGFITIWLEVGITTWSLDLMIDRGMSLRNAVLIVTAIGYFISLSRISFSFVSGATTNFIWIFSTIFMIIGLVMIVTANAPTATLIGLLLAGFGVGPLGAIALARSAASEQGPDIGIASYAIGMGPALGIAPWIMGWVSEALGFSIAYSFILVILVIATLLYVYVDKNVVKR